MTSLPARLDFPVRYRDAGVDIDAANQLKKTIGRLARSTFTPGVVSEVGLFGSLFQLKGWRDPLLVASCDGVGTKLTVARICGCHDTVGTDIVNHCVNDILTLGARPLFFLDYLAGSRLEPALVANVVRGLARACRAHGCALVGGETALMPGWYQGDEFDLVGFILGAVERKRVVDASRIAPGDVLIGLPSNGLHTNGYSLARKVLFERAGLKMDARVKGLRRPLGKELLRPHRSYFSAVYPLLGSLKALAHITGGGFYENLGRLLPSECSCVIHRRSWRPGELFQLIARLGDVPSHEMYRTFNMGIGMVLFCAPGRKARLLASLRGARVIGKVVRGTFGVAVV
ncbi:phosphoribosylformylglycinamidine cyclo-ligase [candidate division WOR-3 bacterium]|nr:phosphoribosylformylglycinamidine cyclo-ligase [candidate division WOR-3 bacterium]